MKKLTQIIDALDSLYENHLSSFDQELLPDLERQTSERGPAVKALNLAVDLYIKNAPENSETRETLEFIRERVSVLLRRNQSLTHRVETYREQLQVSLKNVAAGRRAIRAYGSMAQRKPKILSLTE